MKNYLILLIFFLILAGCITTPEEEINTKLQEADGYLNNSQFEKAENIYNELIGKYPDRSAPYVHKGVFLYDYKQDYRAAERLFEIASQQKDAGYDSFQWLGLIASHRGEYTKAINYFEKSIELDNTKPVTYGMAALEYMNSNQFDKGFLYAKKAIDLNLDKDSKKILLKIMVNVSMDYIDLNPTLAQDTLDYIIKEDPTIGDAYVVKGVIEVKKLNYKNAQEYYETALQKEPNNGNAYVRLCELFYLKEETLTSLDYCEQATPYESSKILAYYYGALGYGKLGNYKKAAEYIEKSLQLDPDDTNNILVAGGIYILKGAEHAKKNESYEMARALLRSIDFNKERTPIEVYEKLGKHYYESRDMQNAKEFIDLALQKTNQLDNVQQRKYLYVYETARKIYSDLADLNNVKWLDEKIGKLKPTDETKDLPAKAEVFEKYGYIDKTIYLVPMDIEKEFASDLALILKDRFKFKFEVLETTQTPPTAYNSLRSQYYVESIESYIEQNYAREGMVFAITSKDITAETTNYVFGNTNSKSGVISIYRFTNEFNNEDKNESQVFRRAVVQSMSTIGKANGLSTPENPKCALAYPHDFDEFKRKEPIFCGTNQRELEGIYATAIWTDNPPQETADINQIYEKYELER